MRDAGNQTSRGQKLNRWTRIIPAAFLMYTIAYIDRTNFSLAIPSLQKEFHLTSGNAGLTSGVFFVGYFLSQMPGGYLAQMWSAKRVIFWALLLWGAAATLCGLSRSLPELLIYRFILGVGEGLVWPATAVLLANWFAPWERGRANGYWVVCQPAAILITGPLSGWLLDRYDWRMMFIVQGLFPIIFAGAWWWAVEDRPSQAKWLKESYCVPSPQETIGPSGSKSPGLSFLLDRNVLVFLVLNFSFACGAYGLLIWLPTAIRSLGPTNNLLIGILTALPYLFAGLGAVWNSRSSDRARERRWHVAVPCFAGGIALVAGFMLSGTLPVLGMLCLCITGASIYASLGPKWALMTEAVPKRAAGVALGLCNGFGNLGGVGGPYAVGALRDSTKSFAAGFIFLGGCLVLCAMLVLLVRPYGISRHNQA